MFTALIVATVATATATALLHTLSALRTPRSYPWS